MGENASRDDNHVTVLLGVNNVTGLTQEVLVDENGRILVSAILSDVDFLDLSDTPDSYVGQANKVVSVKADETGLEFTTPSAGAGDVVGPASSTDNAIARFDLATGKLIQNSTVLVDDSGNITALGNMTGKAGGILITGGTGSGDGLRLSSTSNATKGTINLGNATTGWFLDEVTGYLSLGSSVHTIPTGGGAFPMQLLIHSETSNLGNIFVEVNNDSASAPGIMGGAKSRGTLATRTVVQADDSLFAMYALGFDGTAYAFAASITALVDGTPGTNDMPGRLVFATTKDGAATVTESFRIKKDQNLQFANGVALQTGMTAADALLLQAYDVNGAAYVTFATLTANNEPTMDLASAVTIGGAAIYRAGGTDVVVADGGTGVSSLTAYAVLCGGTTSTGAVQALASVGTSGHVLTSNGAGALPSFQAASGGSDFFGTTEYIMSTATISTFFTSTTVGTGAVSQASQEYTSFATGVTPTSKAFGCRPDFLTTGFAKATKLRVLHTFAEPSTNGKEWIVFGNGESDTATAYAGIRCEMVGGVPKVFAVVRDGTTESTTDITATYGTVTDKKLVTIIYTPATNVLVYINGTLAATMTTNIPLNSDTTSVTRVIFGANNGGDASNNATNIYWYAASRSF